MKEGYKKTELGWIPEEWKIERLKDVADINPDSLNNSYTNDYIAYIDIESVKSGKILTTKILPLASAPSRAKRLVSIGDIIISNVRPNLKSVAQINIKQDNLVCSTGFSVLRGRNVSNDFLFQYSLSDICTKQLVDKTVGSNYPAINTNDIKNIDIIVPSLKEQEKIAEILSTVDSQIDYTDELIEKTKELKKGLMQTLLTRGIGHSEFKKSEVGEIPVEWEVKKFSDVSKINQGLQIAIEDRFKKSSNNRLPYLTIQYINDKDNSDNQYFIENANKSVICNREDILMTRTGNTGMVITNEQGVFHNNFFKVDFNNKELNKDFLVFYLKSTTIQKLILSYAGTTTIPDLKHKDFYRLPVLIPCLEEQIKIADILSSVDLQIDEYENKKAKLEELKKGLMQKLLTGEIRVK